jgi:AhpD family alkylhydroperoxidase
MSRIPPRTTGAFARMIATGSRRAYGRPMRSAGVFAHHPRLLLAYMRYNRAAERAPHVPKPLCELAVLRAATVVGCEFCIDIGSEYARRSGLADEQLLDLHDAHGSDRFDADQLLVIDLATGMSRTPGDVSDELMKRVLARFGTQGTLELTHLIAWENARARLNVALDIEPEGFSEGKVCARPADDVAAARVPAGVSGTG